jgi:ribosome-associated protein
VPDTPSDDDELQPPDRRLVVAPGCAIDPDELRWRFTPSGGPGGQHANRSNTRAEVRFDIGGSPSLSDTQRALLVERLGNELRVVCDQERSQTRNRTLAQQRLIERLGAALRRDPPRRRSRVPRGVNERRLEAKKRRSDTKRGRRWRPSD